VTSTRTEFSETAAERQRMVQVPLSHVSIELGHLYMEDFNRGPKFLREQFERVRPWADVAKQQILPGSPAGSRPRVSMCFMVDDYFNRFSSPSKVIPELIAAAEAEGLSMDYIARESGCAEADGVELAELVQGRLVPDPPPGTNGTRPPVEETGWLCNGQRSPASETTEALQEVAGWKPPIENGVRNHSIFLDVELWDQMPDNRRRRRWSCSFLAAVWQLLRLGLLRNEGRSVVRPRKCPADLPEDWDELPPVIQVSQTANPFTAYQTLSVLDSRFLPVESAVRTILQRVGIDPAVQGQVVERSAREGICMPRDVVERIAYVFLPGNTAR
jgi:hypothetical protein